MAAEVLALVLRLIVVLWRSVTFPLASGYYESRTAVRQDVGHGGPQYPIFREPTAISPPLIAERALMRACGRHAATGLRNRALIVLLYRTGPRINAKAGYMKNQPGTSQAGR